MTTSNAKQVPNLSIELPTPMIPIFESYEDFEQFYTCGLIQFINCEPLSPQEANFANYLLDLEDANPEHCTRFRKEHL